jgi:hypothetical protein
MTWLILALAAAQPAPAPAPITLSAADQAAAFTAAGFARRNGQWRSECDGGGPYTPAQIEQVADLDRDGQPEAIITEGSTFCYGSTETGFALVSRQANGRWRLLISSPGVPTVLTGTPATGLPDLELGGPGFCFPVYRWNGREYVQNRYQYEGRPCRP